MFPSRLFCILEIILTVSFNFVLVLKVFTQWVAVALLGPCLPCSDCQGLENGFGDPLNRVFLT